MQARQQASAHLDADGIHPGHTIGDLRRREARMARRELGEGEPRFRGLSRRCIAAAWIGGHTSVGVVAAAA